MSFRTTFAAFSTTAALTLCQLVSAAIDGDQVIGGPRPEGDAGNEQSSQAMQGLFSGDSASSGALITLLGYAVIIGALAVVVWFLFRSGIIRKNFSKSEGKLKIAETRMLGNRQFLSVVEYGSQKILIGVGPGKIDYLTTLQNSAGEFPEVEAPEVDAKLGGQA
ncbi:flagellar biosynthetic protein FliO [Pelagicoccus sp. NFK12]|uniref:Flagellar biosynthetic protein FliO n=1 Tax=Pelagicoccus enzymogenes TaxID=2773457 RepID=A0A927F574_9BACT|nr:flagellar biosynthetic protein FliO [Pelagicoccus enzymogenes]MBD5778667.1 flagellar biosynthetic protein FliO [Pelagicoccus enzymogenes]MDQ8196961.1 flagellar biosynthetic protein FliO [Pelagicoccus enzymogenes]